MALAAPLYHMSYAEYLALESRSGVRHEFLNQDVFAMAGGTPEHGAIAMALARDLGAALQGRPCRVFSSDVRIRVAETGLSTYPDLSVVCAKRQVDPEDPDALVNPIVIVEVLSPSTEAYDRGAKAAHYRRLSSLKEYVLVSQDEPLVEVMRRNDQGVWELHEARKGERFTLASLGVSLDVASIYANPLEA